MADDDFATDDLGGLGDAPKGKFNLKVILIVVGLGIVLGGGGFFAIKTFMGKSSKTQETKVEDKAKKEQTPSAETATKEDGAEKKGTETQGAAGANTQTATAAGPSIMSLGVFTVNLNDPFGRRYAELELALVLDKKELIDQIQNNVYVMSKIKNEIIMTLSAKTFNDLKTVEGKITLMEEIKMRLNEIIKQTMKLPSEPISEVLQTKFLMQ
ncbi:MAG: flagellar basal body-associated protein FliL [Candidatus Omnitrophota bacterium]